MLLVGCLSVRQVADQIAIYQNKKMQAEHEHARMSEVAADQNAELERVSSDYEILRVQVADPRYAHCGQRTCMGRTLEALGILPGGANYAHYHPEEAAAQNIAEEAFILADARLRKREGDLTVGLEEVGETWFSRFGEVSKFNCEGLEEASLTLMSTLPTELCCTILLPW